MADPFSILASVLSTLDVSLRACKGLNDTIHAYKEAPLEREQLQRTIKNVDSVLRNLRLFITEYPSSRAAVHYHEALPEAVRDCVSVISRALEELENLLSHSNDVLQAKQRLRWVLRKKRFLELLKLLDSSQITLNLSLQAVTQ